MKAQGIVAAMLLIIAGLSGCATMSGDECLTSDWAAIGYEDGARGYTSDRLSQHRKACAKHGVTVDFAAYRDGREQGLEEYCQPGRGFDIGVNGGRYNGVCSVDLEADFLDAYNAGYHLYSLRSNVSRTRRRQSTQRKTSWSASERRYAIKRPSWSMVTRPRRTGCCCSPT